MHISLGVTMDLAGSVLHVTTEGPSSYTWARSDVTCAGLHQELERPYSVQGPGIHDSH